MGDRKRTGTVEGIPPGCDAIKSRLLLAAGIGLSKCAAFFQKRGSEENFPIPARAHEQ